jgi:sarcosine oxidase, subunit gamma
MPETPPRRAALPDAALMSDHELSLAMKPPMARFVLRGDGEAAVRAGAALGMVVPTAPLSSSVEGESAALWLGPDEWLLLAPSADASALAGRLAKTIAGHPHSLVDVSHRQVALSLGGRLAARVLSSGCPLDLGLKAFPVGMVARTLFHKAELVLWRRPEGFHCEVWRSFAPYVAGHLAEARRGAEGLTDKALP